MSRLTTAGARGRAFAPLLRLTLLTTVAFGACGDGEERILPADSYGDGFDATGGRRSSTAGGTVGTLVGGTGGDSSRGGTKDKAGNGVILTGGRATAATGGSSTGGRSVSPTGGRGTGASSTGAGAGGDAGASVGGAAGEGGIGGEGGMGIYLGPSVGLAQPFAMLAYSEITAANLTPVVGELGVSAAAVAQIIGFPDNLGYVKYGLDSMVPNDQKTINAQGDVTVLVGNINPRACDDNRTATGMTGDITLSPGVTCMNSFVDDMLLNGIVTLDAGDDPNAFFIIRGNLALNAALGTQILLVNGAQACSVFWRINTAVTIATSVPFVGTVIAGSAITMVTGATLEGRALAQTEGVHVDANSVTIPSSCTHLE